MDVEFTKMSGKGQVVIPGPIRKEMHLRSGTPFAVVRKGDVIFLKKIKMPTLEDFGRLVAKGEKIARKHKLKPKDVPRIVHKHRGVKE